MPIAESPEFTREEVALALRNPGMPLEGLRHAVTPVGMHYVLVHFDVPALDEASHRLARRARRHAARPLARRPRRARR